MVIVVAMETVGTTNVTTQFIISVMLLRQLLLLFVVVI